MFTVYFTTALWLLCFLVAVFAPLRWSMVAFLCISAIDFGGGRGTFAMYNVLKGLALPVILLWRTRAYSGHRYVLPGMLGWLMLIAYVSIASFWSHFPESAAKLVFQMLGETFAVVAMVRATKGGLLTAKSAVYASLGALALGFCATYVTHGWGDDVSRFSAFIPAQSYASFLVGLYCVILCGRDIALPVRLTLCPVLMAAVIWNGSRTWFLGMLLATCLSAILVKGKAWLKVCGAALCVGLVALLIGGADRLLGFISEKAADNRIASALTAFSEHNTHSTGLGTLNFRRENYEAIIDRLKKSSPSELLFGHGTCNAALVTGSRFREYAKMSDPNRMVHDEWLRVTYEWGLIGFTCWLVLMGSLVGYAIRGVRIDPEGDAKPLLLYLAPFLIGLSTENMLAGSVNAVSMAFLFTIALASVPHRLRTRRVAHPSGGRTAGDFEWAARASQGARA